MGRPRDWSPLASSDPVPGAPEAITIEARRLRDTASEMRSQISRLKAIGHDDNTGRYADTLRTAASDLAGKLDKTVGRYQQVAGALSAWAPELTHAQDESVRALEKARAAEAARAANTVVQAAPQPGDPPPTPAEQAREQRRQAALDQAHRDLTAAHRQLNDAVDHARSTGRHYAGQIKDAIDDGVKDSWWDNVKGWVDRNAGWIKAVTTVLSYVATALAVVALFIPGLNLIAIGLLVTVGLSQGLLAASGNGSWADVALTVFAIATLGLGGLAAGALKGAQAATRAAGMGAARSAARTAALRSSSAARTAAGRVLSRRGVSAAQRRGARNFIDAAKGDARQAGSRAARDVRDAPLATVHPAQSVRSGGKEAARYYNDIAGMRTRFPTDAGVQHAAGRADVLRNTSAGLSGSGTAADFGDKALELGGVQSYRDAKGHFRKEVGSTW